MIEIWELNKNVLIIRKEDLPTMALIYTILKVFYSSSSKTLMLVGVSGQIRRKINSYVNRGFFSGGVIYLILNRTTN